MIKGADVSSLLEVEQAGGRFFDADGTEGDLLAILKQHGCNLIRLRLWNDPYDEAGKPYGAGTNDLQSVMALAKRCKALGLPWLLDFHYSDFWADPGKQYPPKAWAALDADGLEQAVFEFTKQTLLTLKQADLLPALVAPGNELSNGLLWPLGKVPNWDNITRFVSAGLRAVRQVSPSIKTMIHLDNGGNGELYRYWFDSWFAHGGEDFDVIGLSYYPFWHGTLDALDANLHALAVRYGKPMLITETSMAFTLEECAAREGLRPEDKKGLAANEKTAAAVPYPCTREGQARFLSDLCGVIRSVPDGLGLGFVWWEPAWLPVPGAEWSKPEGLAYVHETGPGGNEWANQALFDYDGKALPTLSLFRTR